jgi:primase-polymerase (primpol)-like protein
MLGNIPFEMQAYPNWIVWRLEWLADDHQRQRKPTKVPYSVKTLRKASTTNPEDWSTFLKRARYRSIRLRRLKLPPRSR